MDTHDKPPAGEAYLEHKSNDKHHGNAGHDIRMVLNDKFMAKYWRILVLVGWSSHSHVCQQKAPKSSVMWLTLLLAAGSDVYTTMQRETDAEFL